MPDDDKSQHPVKMSERVADIWEPLLGRRPASQDDFFQLGGDSLLAARATAQLGRSLGALIDLSLLIEHSVLSEYAACVAAAVDPSLVKPAAR